MNVRAIKTPETTAIVGNIKRLVKNEGLGLNYNIPKEFIEKRNYMQSDEFLTDPHNKKMFDLGEQLGVARDKIGEKIRVINERRGEKLAQAINGFTRLKSQLEAVPELNFNKVPYFNSLEENKYTKLMNSSIQGIARNENIRIKQSFQK